MIKCNAVIFIDEKITEWLNQCVASKMIDAALPTPNSSGVSIDALAHNTARPTLRKLPKFSDYSESFGLMCVVRNTHTYAEMDPSHTFLSEFNSATLLCEAAPASTETNAWIIVAINLDVLYEIATSEISRLSAVKTEIGMLSQPQPLYEQIKAHVLDKIADGTFRPGAKIPSENQLANELGASRLTAHRALRELTASGVLERINGVGTFVAQPRASSTFVLLHNIADDIRKRGKALSITVRSLEKQSAPLEIAQKMGAKPKDKLFHSVIIYAADGSPIQLEDRYVAPDFAPQFLSQDFTKRSTTDYLQTIALPTRTEHEIQSLLPSAFEAECLDLGAGEPCLVVSRKTWVGQMMTTFTRFVHPGARHSFVTQESLEERR